MKLTDIDKSTEGTFFRCLHDECPEDPRLIALRRRWYDYHKDKGFRGKVLVDENEIRGLCQYIPIEHSHLAGNDLMAILCMWIHGYDHLVGNQQGKGYGRFMLEQIEKDSQSFGMKGVAAWGMDFPYWNPVSFYEHMGYTRVDNDGAVVIVWKPFTEDARKPALLHLKQTITPGKEKVKVSAFINGWCSGSCGVHVAAKEAVLRVPDLADYEEIVTIEQKTRISCGVSSSLYLDSNLFIMQDPSNVSEQIQEEIQRLYLEKLPNNGSEFTDAP